MLLERCLCPFSTGSGLDSLHRVARENTGHPTISWDIPVLKTNENYMVFFLNSSLTGCPVLLFKKSDISIPVIRATHFTLWGCPPFSSSLGLGKTGRDTKCLLVNLGAPLECPLSWRQENIDREC